MKAGTGDPPYAVQVAVILSLLLLISYSIVSSSSSGSVMKIEDLFDTKTSDILIEKKYMIMICLYDNSLGKKHDC